MPSLLDCLIKRSLGANRRFLPARLLTTAFDDALRQIRDDIIFLLPECLPYHWNGIPTSRSVDTLGLSSGERESATKVSSAHLWVPVCC